MFTYGNDIPLHEVPKTETMPVKNESQSTSAPESMAFAYGQDIPLDSVNK